MALSSAAAAADIQACTQGLHLTECRFAIAGQRGAGAANQQQVDRNEPKQAAALSSRLIFFYVNKRAPTAPNQSSLGKASNAKTTMHAVESGRR